ncbi:MAG: NAD-dependent epimerase/dehydratase family protein [Pseudomonadota bacterium]
MSILVTGAAGFIGAATVQRLLARGDDVVGFDIINDYYDPSLKRARLARLEAAAAKTKATFTFVEADLAETAAVNKCFTDRAFDRVIHLAAQAGVRHSITHPHDYVNSNLIGFTNILEACRHNGIAHLVYASTSSVYGANKQMPFSEEHAADHPLQFYAATKRANELMAHSYAHLFALPTTGLRFFTVYGPWGRPDMAPILFTKAILAGQTIKVFNNGDHSRDFTFIDDIVEGVLRTCDQPPKATPPPEASPGPAPSPSPATSSAPYRVFNIGCGRPIKLHDFISAIEKATGRTANKEYHPLQPGDVKDTFCDVRLLAEAVGYRPQVDIEDGVAQLVDWYRGYFS